MIYNVINAFFQMIDINDEAGADPFPHEGILVQGDLVIDVLEQDLGQGLSVRG